MFKAIETGTGKTVRGFLMKMSNSNDEYVIVSNGMSWVDGGEWSCDDFIFVEKDSIEFIGLNK